MVHFIYICHYLGYETRTAYINVLINDILSVLLNLLIKIQCYADSLRTIWPRVVSVTDFDKSLI